MAEELDEKTEKKPAFVVHKKSQDSQNSAGASTAQPEKKKVIVVKRKSASESGEVKTQAADAPKKVVVKKAAEPVAKPAAQPVEEKKEAPKPAAPAQPAAANANNNGRIVNRNPNFELNPSRPNVKAGNLSDKPRGRYGNGGYNNNSNGFNNNNGGYGQRQGGYNNQNRQGGFAGGQGRQGGGFTGAQARQGYQNRENYNRDGQRQGGFNRNGQGGNFQNRQGGQGGQGGFNRNGQGGQRPFGNNGGQGGFKPRMGGAPAPMPVDQSRQQSAKKAAFKGKKQVYNRKDEEQYDDNLFGQKKKSETPASVVPKSIDMMETISVSDLAKKMNLKASEIIGKLFSMGMMVSINQSIDADTAELLCAEYNCEVHRVSLYDETVIQSESDEGAELLPRAPIVTVMGHVDHGKTKTLDAIRNANVAAGEAGGITQKIGAYSVSTEKGKITFLDTPGHEAFTLMRSRGAQVTDIVVLVVAADDGIMPQTLEAIDHAKAAKVPIIVAVNKIDKPEANVDRVMTQLSERGLVPEEWGGDTQFVRISALKREGIDDLLDAILLQAEMLELTANFECRAEGKILESRVDQGRGVVASVVVERGTLHQGDPFVAGIFSGRVRAMFDDHGKRIQEAGPSTPVEVLGMDEMPMAGDPFQVTEDEKEARAISTKRQELKRFEAAKAVKKVTLENMFSTIDESKIQELKVIIKADLQGSAEALKISLEKLTTKEIRLNVIHSSAGAINESDVTLAAADNADANAIIIGFNVRPTPNAKALADKEGVEIRKYSIIYKAVEEIQQAMEGMLRPDTKEQVTGMLEVRNTFKVPKVGTIAGCYVTEGVVRRTSYVNLIRDGVVKYTGKLASLKRFKDDAKEVSTGYECGVGLENWQDIMVGDQIEAFEYIEIKRKLGDDLVDDRAENEKKAAEAAAKAKAEQDAIAAAEAEEKAKEKAEGKARKAAAAGKSE
ncbi:MAG: translation initiation factor IF-2 [Treponema sp.]|nr:translation initiation factor IF-2 [Treponema sp.]